MYSLLFCGVATPETQCALLGLHGRSVVPQTHPFQGIKSYVSCMQARSTCGARNSSGFRFRYQLRAATHLGPVEKTPYSCARAEPVVSRNETGFGSSGSTMIVAQHSAESLAPSDWFVNFASVGDGLQQPVS